MEITRRDWLAAATFVGIVPSVAAAQESASSRPAAAPGALTEQSLKQLLEAMKLRPTQNQSRFDFAFTRKPKDGEDWNLSMSAVLSADGQSIWIMAWLDELPRSSRDVPRTALLKLLAENDLMGKGKFFSYIPANRRFALQQVIENHDMTTRKFHTILVDLGDTVIETFAFWSTDAWKEPAATETTASSQADAGPMPTQTNSNTVNQPANQTVQPKTTSGATARPRTASKSTTSKQ